jgi:hypothetical protein
LENKIDLSEIIVDFCGVSGHNFYWE